MARYARFFNSAVLIIVQVGAKEKDLGTVSHESFPVTRCINGCSEPGSRSGVSMTSRIVWYLPMMMMLNILKSLSLKESQMLNPSPPQITCPSSVVTENLRAFDRTTPIDVDVRRRASRQLGARRSAFDRARETSRDHARSALARERRGRRICAVARC